MTDAARANDAGADAAQAPSTVSGLSDRDIAILAFEKEWWRHAGAKEEAIRREFGLSAARYYQVLNALIDTSGAIAHDPLLVRRLHRVRDSRMTTRASRSGRTTAVDRSRLDD